MSEYIITCDEETASWIGNNVDSMRPLVRCRDCKYVSRDEKIYRECYRLHGYNSFTVEEYGFCKWGEPKEGSA